MVDGPDVGSPATSSVPPGRVPGSMGVRVSLPQSASHRNAAGGDPKGSEDRADRTTEEQPNSLLRLRRPHSTTRECGRFSSADRAHLPRWSLRCSLTHVRVRSLRSSLPPCIWTPRPTSAPAHRAHLPRWSLRCSLTHVRVRSLRSSLPPCIWTLSADERPIPQGPSAALVAAVLAHARPSARDPCAKTSSRPHVRAPDGMFRQRTVRDSAGGRSTTHTRGKRSPRCRSTTRRGADGRRCY